jgi:hypothetical protein
MTTETRELLHGYMDAHKLVAADYGADIDWADGLRNVKPDAYYVLREGAWVIVNSGFRYAVARKLWPALTEAFNDFDPPLVTSDCLKRALAILNHKRKMVAILSLADEVRSQDGEGWKQIVLDAQDPPKLTRLPYIGKITCWHYAKVLGADVVKPDVHLERAAKAAGFATPLALCEKIRDQLGERITVIDSVLWRYGEQQKKRGWPEWDALWAKGVESTASLDQACVVTHTSTREETSPSRR